MTIDICISEENGRGKRGLFFVLFPLGPVTLFSPTTSSYIYGFINLGINSDRHSTEPSRMDGNTQSFSISSLSLWRTVAYCHSLSGWICGGSLKQCNCMFFHGNMHFFLLVVCIRTTYLPRTYEVHRPAMHIKGSTFFCT